MADRGSIIGIMIIVRGEDMGRTVTTESHPE